MVELCVRLQYNSATQGFYRSICLYTLECRNSIILIIGRGMELARCMPLNKLLLRSAPELPLRNNGSPVGINIHN